MNSRIAPSGFAVLVAVLVFSQAAFGATPTVVNVHLQDTSTDPSVTAMRITVDHDSVNAGKVTFRTVNQSKNTVHELLVIRTKAGQTTLPYSEKEQEVEEKHIDRRGEIDKMKPGAVRSMTLNLKPGSYLLICNEAGHYKAGMWVPFTVTK